MNRLRADLGLIAFASLSFYLTIAFSRAELSESGRRNLVPPPEYIERMQFGFKESMADSFWLRWVQDADTCYSYSGAPERLPEIPEEERVARAKRDILFNPRHKVCDNSWAFKMLDAVTKLDPRFVMPYMLGAPALSVLVEDYEGASVIFNRAIAAYPNDWQISYRAAYHFMYDKQDLPKAARLLESAVAHGAPEWLASLAARLYTKSGQLELAIASLEGYRKSFRDEKQAVEVDRRIAGLKAQLRDENSRGK